MMFLLPSTEVASEAAESSGPSSQSGSILSSLRTVHVRGFPTQVSAQDIIDVSSSKSMHQI